MLSHEFYVRWLSLLRGEVIASSESVGIILRPSMLQRFRLHAITAMAATSVKMLREPRIRQSSEHDVLCFDAVRLQQRFQAVR